MRASRRLLLAVAIGLAMAGSACGGSEEERAGGGTSGSARPVTEGTSRGTGAEQGPAFAASASTASSDARSNATPAPAWEPRPDDPREAEHPVEDPSGLALRGFYEALARADDDEAGALVRVVHMGDSSIGMDQLPHYLRTRFQTRFGDGGAGFVLLQPHSASYRNNAVHLHVPLEWQFCFITYRCRSDGHYGLGGVVAESMGGSTTVVRTRSDGDHGRSASRIELWYAGTPRGGRIELRIDDGPPQVLDTEAPTLESRWHAVDVEPGPHRVRVRAAGGGRVRAYGVVMETTGPGVVWDTLSMIGAFTPRLLAHDEAHFREQLSHRAPDLVVLGYGGNDLRRIAGGAVTPQGFQEETRALLARVREARPEAGCLLTGVVEHEMSGSARITPHEVEAVVAAQRAAARDAGCAYFDVYEAMGGDGSFRRWMRRGLASDDRKHLTPEGRRVVAGWMYEALVAGYAAHRTSHPSPQRP